MDSLSKIKMGEKSVLDVLTGKRFGRLEVLNRAPSITRKNGKKETRWYVVCDCNKNKVFPVRATSLKNGDTQSCGCLHKELFLECSKKVNFYEKDEVLGCFRLYNQERTSFCLIDEEDISKLKEKYWSQDCNGYWSNRNKNNFTYIQDIIMNPGTDEVVDHVLRVRHDNRKKYLRICTSQQNSFNKGLYTTNSSGFMGVTWDKNREKWVAQLHFNGRHYNLGRFNNQEDAIKARLKGELKYFGIDFAPQRHLFEKYNINEVSLSED